MAELTPFLYHCIAIAISVFQIVASIFVWWLPATWARPWLVNSLTTRRRYNFKSTHYNTNNLLQNSNKYYKNNNTNMQIK